MNPRINTHFLGDLRMVNAPFNEFRVPFQEVEAASWKESALTQHTLFLV